MWSLRIASGSAAAQEEKQVWYSLEGWWFDPCSSLNGQDTNLSCSVMDPSSVNVG